MRCRIVERRKTVLQMGAEGAEFGKVHPSEKMFEIETIGWPPKTIKSFNAFSAALKWAKCNQVEIGEIA